MALEKTFVLRDRLIVDRMWAFIGLHWEMLANTKKPLEVIIRQLSSKRSSQQNKRYQAILTQIAEEGDANGVKYSKEAWHEYFKREFIGVMDLPLGGTIGISTTMLDTEEFNEYMLKVEVFAAQELGLTLTEPYEPQGRP